jgi:hypothetical protein
MWEAIEHQPECEDFAEEVASCYDALAVAHPED